jgi:hypothetical protein
VDDAPAFIILGASHYYHRIPRQTLSKESVDKAMSSDGYTPKQGEIGIAPADWKDGHDGVWDSISSVTPPSGNPITASVTTPANGAVDAVSVITVSGGPADKQYMITVTTKEASSAGDDVQNITVAKNATVDQAASDIASAISDPNVTASASGGVVTVAPKSGKAVEKLEVAVS